MMPRGPFQPLPFCENTELKGKKASFFNAVFAYSVQSKIFEDQQSNSEYNVNMSHSRSN